MSQMNRWQSVFGRLRPVIIGMIHVKAMPGTPRHSNTVEEIVEHACREATIYKKANIDAVLVENMHDVPYNDFSTTAAPEIIASMTRVATEVKKVLDKRPCGIQLLAAGNQPALAVALAAGCDFIRAESYVFSHIADEGLMNACAGPLLRFRKSIDADHIMVLTDIKKKHSSHAITADVDLIETVKAAEFFLSDGVIVTGKATGDPASTAELKEILKVAKGPVLVGSGVTENNVRNYQSCHGGRRNFVLITS